MGDVLLDYRNYLELEIEVQRGADGWLRAEAGRSPPVRRSVPVRPSS